MPKRNRTDPDERFRELLCTAFFQRLSLWSERERQNPTADRSAPNLGCARANGASTALFFARTRSVSRISQGHISLANAEVTLARLRRPFDPNLECRRGKRNARLDSLTRHFSVSDCSTLCFNRRSSWPMSRRASSPRARESRRQSHPLEYLA